MVASQPFVRLLGYKLAFLVVLPVLCASIPLRKYKHLGGLFVLFIVWGKTDVYVRS